MILHLLFFIILVPWAVIALVEVHGLPIRPHCTRGCGNVAIPFPFGIEPGCYIDDWFAIDCNFSKPFIRRNNLQVLEISIKASTVHVSYQVFKSCNQNETAGKFVNLKETPFVFSETSNRFIGVGCAEFVFHSNDNSFIGGCLSTCNGTSNAGENSYCQAKFPLSFKTFNISANSTNGDRQQQCKYASLVDQQWFQKNLQNPQEIRNMTQVPVVLDWGIYNSSFNFFASNQFMSHNSTSYCEISDNTTSSSSQFPTVRCQCLKGFQGNPYVLEGCEGTVNVAA